MQLIHQTLRRLSNGCTKLLLQDMFELSTSLPFVYIKVVARVGILRKRYENYTCLTINFTEQTQLVWIETSCFVTI